LTPTISTEAPEMMTAETALEDALEQSGTEECLLGLQRAVSAVSHTWKTEAFTPPVPETLAETGLHVATVEQLILKHLYNRGEVIGRELANLLGLKFSLIDAILDGLKRQHLAQVKGSLGYGAVSSVFSLSELGRARAHDCLDHNQYCGAAPVPVSQYAKGVCAQSLRNGWLKREALLSAFGHMVIQPEVVNQLDPR
jgi:DNA-binding MarR family transcriptional regulator